VDEASANTFSASSFVNGPRRRRPPAALAFATAALCPTSRFFADSVAVVTRALLTKTFNVSAPEGRLPRLFGGDQAEANRCLARALALDPSHPVGRRYAVADGLVVDETVVLAGQPGPGPEPTESQWQ
jgi:hypothetical protein